MTEPNRAGDAGLARRNVLAGGLAVASSAAAPAPNPNRPDPAAPARRAAPIVELRQYTCHAGRRDDLIALFERAFIEPQDALGAAVLGIFRDRDDPDRFVWLRGFVSMPRRTEALEAFYSGPVWREHHGAANATMLDSDNVLLLHPAEAGGGFDLASRAARRSGEILAFIHYLDDGLLAPFSAFFASTLRPQAQAMGGEVLATFASETGPNTFPRLPVRERDRVFVWFARPPAGGEARFLAAYHRRTGWRDGAPEALLPAFMRKPEILHLQATARSRIA